MDPGVIQFSSWVSYFVFVLIQKLHGERNTGYIWLNRKVFLMWKRAFEGVFRRRSATKRTGVIKSRKSNKFLHRLQMHWHTVDLTSYGMDKVQGKFSLWTRKPEHLRIYGIVETRRHSFKCYMLKHKQNKTFSTRKSLAVHKRRFPE